MNREADFTIERWDAIDEYIMCYKGKPLGMTVTMREGIAIKRWIGVALDELLRTIEEEKTIAKLRDASVK